MRANPSGLWSSSDPHSRLALHLPERDAAQSDTITRQTNTRVTAIYVGQRDIDGFTLRDTCDPGALIQTLVKRSPSYLSLGTGPTKAFREAGRLITETRQ